MPTKKQIKTKNNVITKVHILDCKAAFFDNLCVEFMNSTYTGEHRFAIQAVLNALAKERHEIEDWVDDDLEGEEVDDDWVPGSSIDDDKDDDETTTCSSNSEEETEAELTQSGESQQDK